MQTYYGMVLWVDTGTVLQGTSLIDKGGVLIILVLDVNSQSGGGWETLSLIPGSILKHKTQEVEIEMWTIEKY